MRRLREQIRAVAVVIPARQEQERIAAVIESVAAAAEHPDVVHVPVHVAVAVDGTADATALIAARCRATVVPGRFGTPSRARQAAVDATRIRFNVAPSQVWVASTDADCIVPVDWISAHLEHAGHADALAGGICIRDWTDQPNARQAYEELLDSRRRPHGQHTGVYGANLGIRLSALNTVGGFPDAPVSEDHELIGLVESHGLGLCRPQHPQVTTSARADGRATGGLSDLLSELAQRSTHPKLLQSLSQDEVAS